MWDVVATAGVGISIILAIGWKLLSTQGKLTKAIEEIGKLRLKNAESEHDLNFTRSALEEKNDELKRERAALLLAGELIEQNVSRGTVVEVPADIALALARLRKTAGPS